MTIAGFDVDSYNKSGFDFARAYAQGFRASWVKLGGNNMTGNAPYTMSGWSGFAAAQQATPFEQRGAYWMVGGSDPANAARHYLRSLGSFGVTKHMLDNEIIDAGNLWNDNEACTFFDVLNGEGGIPYADMWMYGSRDATWNTQAWAGLARRGIKAWVALYNGNPFVSINPRTYPSELVLAHQFTSSASIGGLAAVDADAFADGAFTPATPQRKVADMPTVYGTNSANDPSAPVEVYALNEGGYPGPDNWKETGDAGLASAWAQNTLRAGAIWLSPGTYADWKTKATTPPPVGSVTVPPIEFDYTKLAEALTGNNTAAAAAIADTLASRLAA